jgi:hypothetical protein
MLANYSYVSSMVLKNAKGRKGKENDTASTT